MFAAEFPVLRHQERVVPQRQTLHRQLDQVFVQVAIIGEFHGPFLHWLLADQPLLHLVAHGFLACFRTGHAYDPHTHTAHIAVAERELESLIRYGGLLHFQPQRRIFQRGLQLFATLRAEGSRELRNGFVAEIACGAVLPLQFITCEPLEFSSFLLMPTRDAIRDFGPARVVR